MDEIVCFCKNIKRNDIEAAALSGATTLREIRAVTGACTGNQCKELNPEGICCSHAILEIVYNIKKSQQKFICCMIIYTRFHNN
jgi:bacterioferritin-associated ferredoxin